jgi:hypothetical protein
MSFEVKFPLNFVYGDLDVSGDLDIGGDVTVDGFFGVGTNTPNDAEKARINGDLYVDENCRVGGAQSYQRHDCTASSDAFDVSGVAVLFVSAAGGDVFLGGFSGGVSGQVIDIVKGVSTGTVTLEHNEASGTQKFFNNSGADVAITGYGGTRYVCNGSSWFEQAN